MPWTSSDNLALRRLLSIPYWERNGLQDLMDGIRNEAVIAAIQADIAAIAKIDAEISEGVGADGIKEVEGIIFSSGGKSSGLYKQRRMVVNRIATEIGINYPSANRLYRG